MWCLHRWAWYQSFGLPRNPVEVEIPTKLSILLIDWFVKILCCFPLSGHRHILNTSSLWMVEFAQIIKDEFTQHGKNIAFIIFLHGAGVCRQYVKMFTSKQNSLVEFGKVWGQVFYINTIPVTIHCFLALISCESFVKSSRGPDPQVGKPCSKLNLNCYHYLTLTVTVN